MPGVPDLDSLPPQARFTVRGLAAGLTPAEVASVLRVDGRDGEEDPGGAPGARHLRRIVRSLGGPPLTAASGDDALRAALAPALAAAAATPSARRPGTVCPTADILRELALGRLDGPLMLAEAEHAADCPACMAGLVAARRAGDGDAGLTPSIRTAPRPLVRWDVPLVLGVLAGVGLVAAYLFWR